MVFLGEQIQRYGQAGCSPLSAGSLSNNSARLHPRRACRLTSTRINDSPVSRCLPTDMFHEPSARRHRPRDPIVHTTTLSSRRDVSSAALSGLYTFKVNRGDTRGQQASTCHSSSGYNPYNKEVQTLFTTHEKTPSQVSRVKRCVARLPREELPGAERRSSCFADAISPTLSWP